MSTTVLYRLSLATGRPPCHQRRITSVELNVNGSQEQWCQWRVPSSFISVSSDNRRCVQLKVTSHAPHRRYMSSILLHSPSHMPVGLQNYDIDIAAVTQTHIKAKHSDSIVAIRHGTGSLGHRVNWSFGSSFTSRSPGHHFDPA